MKFIRDAWMILHMLLCVGAVMLGYDRNMPWWELIILVSLAYFANDIVLFVARLCLGRRRLRRLTSRFEIPTSLRD